MVPRNQCYDHQSPHVSCREGRLERLLCLGCNPCEMTPVTIFPVNQRRMLRHAIIPHYYRAFFPLDPGVEIRAPCNMLVQEL